MLSVNKLIFVVTALFSCLAWGESDVFIPKDDVKFVRVYIAPSIKGNTRTILIQKIKNLQLVPEVAPVTRDLYSFRGTCTFSAEGKSNYLECWDFKHAGHLKKQLLKSLDEGTEVARAFSARCYNPILIPSQKPPVFSLAT